MHFRVVGLKAIIISDRDGVPVLKLSKENNKFPELGSKQQFLATFSISNEQSSKMLLGRNKSIITMFKSSTIIQLNKYPLIITFIGTENCNTGHILAFENEVDRYLEEYKIILDHNLM